jgi:hypothetical protein
MTNATKPQFRSPKRFNFLHTSGSIDFLNETGNRRFWVVELSAANSNQAATKQSDAPNTKVASE